MAKFTVEHQTPHSVSECYEKLKNFLSHDDGIKKFDSKVKLSFDDGQKSCQLNGSQFKAEVSVAQKGSSSLVSIIVDLPFLLMPLKGKIQESLEKMLKKHLV